MLELGGGAGESACNSFKWLTPKQKLHNEKNLFTIAFHSIYILIVGLTSPDRSKKWISCSHTLNSHQFDSNLLQSTTMGSSRWAVAMLEARENYMNGSNVATLSTKTTQQHSEIGNIWLFFTLSNHWVNWFIPFNRNWIDFCQFVQMKWTESRKNSEKQKKERNTAIIWNKIEENVIFSIKID